MAMTSIVAGCSGQIENEADPVPEFSYFPKDNVFPLIVSTDWSLDEQTTIIDAIGFWQMVLNPNTVTLVISIAGCSDDDFGCIRPVEYDPVLAEFDDPEDPNTVVGLCNHGVMSILYNFADIESVAIHEMGHYFGLGHEPTGVMAPGTGEMSYMLGPQGVAALRSYSFL